MHADEAKVVGKLIDEGMALGYTVSVYDGDEWTVKCSANKVEILEALDTTGIDRVRFYEGVDSVGTFLLVYGNEPYYVINDFSDNPKSVALFNKVEPLIDELEALAGEVAGF